MINKNNYRMLLKNNNHLLSKTINKKINIDNKN